MQLLFIFFGNWKFAPWLDENQIYNVFPQTSSILELEFLLRVSKNIP